MGFRTMRALGVLGASLGAFLIPATAHAAFDVRPSACLAHPQPERPGTSPAFALFGYDNPNPVAVDIPLGSDNLVLQPPNFRRSQPTTFFPGRHDGAWVVRFDVVNQPVVEWVLQGALVGTESAVCGGGDPPAPLPAPTLASGAPTAAVGDALAVGVDRTSGAGAVASAIQRCDAGSCTTVSDLDDPGAPRSAYTVAAADAGYDLRVVAVHLTVNGWASSLSTRVSVPGPAIGPAPQEPASDASAVAPEALRQPSIAGTAGAGLTLSAAPGRWAGSPDPSLAIRWQRCDPTVCADIQGAVGSQYVPGADDVGHRLRAVVAATAGGLSTFVPTGTVTETAASEPTPPVTPAPALQAAPVISGRADVGAVLTVADAGRFDVGVSRAIQWQSCAGSDCHDLPGATGTTYRMQASDAGLDLRAAVAATSSGGRTLAVSNRIGPAGAVRPSAPPRLIGATRAGTTLWTDGGTWRGVPAPGLSFQWLRCDAAGNACVAIAAAAGPGYTPTSADVGRRLRVRVTATNGFSTATATSGPSAVVVAPAASAPPVVSTPPVDHIRPAVTRLHATPQHFRRSAMVTTLTAVRAPRVRRGTILRLRVSEAAWLRIDVVRRGAGTHRSIGTLTRVLSAGEHRLRFTGRLPRAQGGRLPAGGYLLSVRATDPAGNVSRQRVVRIRIVR